MGYLIIDNRVSGGPVEEYDTKRCPHCCGVIQVPTQRRELGGQQLRGKHVDQGYFCGKCMAPLCEDCAREAERFGCRPFMEKLIAKMKRLEGRKRFLESIQN